MALGWPVGDVLGSEADLLERYQVSRAVFREAVRLVEHQQVARTRRGPGGGLVITEPTVGAVIDAVVLYLHRVDARLDEIFEARIILEEIACQLAAERTDEDDLAAAPALRRGRSGRTRERPARSCTRWSAPSAATRGSSCSSTSSTGSHSCTRLTGRASAAAIAKETRHAHAMIAEAIMAGDAGLARNRMRKHLQAEADFFRRRRSTRQLLPDSVVLAESGLGQRCRGGGARHHPDRRGRGTAARRAGGDRARADRARGGQPRPAAGGGAAARAPSDRPHAPGTGRRPLRHGAERQRRHGDGRHLPGAAGHAAGRAGRAAHGGRGGDHGPGRGAHRRRGDGGTARTPWPGRSTPPTPSGPRRCTTCMPPWPPRRTTGCSSWSPWC